MAQVGKYLNLHSHMQRWGVYSENGPYIADYVIGYVYPAKSNGVSFEILEDKGGDIYIINAKGIGRCAIWAPRDNDSSITTSPLFSLGGVSGGSGGGNPGTGNGKYLNLKSHMQRWAVYNENGPYTTDYLIGYVYPAESGGVSFKILEEKGGDVYIINAKGIGRCAIWAPIDNDSLITISPLYDSGDGSGSGNPGGELGNYLNLNRHMQRWAVYNENGPYTTDYLIGYVYPAESGGLSFTILDERGGDVYIINVKGIGRCAIWAPRDNDSSITTTPLYTLGDGSSSNNPGVGSGDYLNLHRHMQRWGVYNESGPYTTDYVIGYVYPAKSNGLSFTILDDRGGDVYIINVKGIGRCAIWAPRDNDSSITTTPSYTLGDGSSGGNSDGETGPGGDIGNGNDSIKICTRAEWYAKPVINSGMSGIRTTPYKYIIIHNSGAEQSTLDLAQMQSIQSYHQSIDWGDIGYNYCIGKYGTVMQGRETKYVGAHTLGERNRDGIGVCLFGNFNISNPSQKQIDNLIPLLVLLCKQYNIDTNNIMGHRDHGPTSCPGDRLYSLLSDIRTKVQERIDNNKYSTHIISNGLGKSFGKDAYSLSYIKPYHKESIISNKHIDISIAAELIQDGALIPLSSENYKKIQNMSDKNELFEGISGILFDTLPAPVATEVKSLCSGIEKYEISTGKISIDVTEGDIVFNALELAAILKYPNDVMVREVLSFDGKINIDDIVKLGKGTALLVIAIACFFTAVDELAGMLIAIWNIIKTIFSY